MSQPIRSVEGEPQSVWAAGSVCLSSASLLQLQRTRGFGTIEVTDPGGTDRSRQQDCWIEWLHANDLFANEGTDQVMFADGRKLAA